MSGTKYSDRQIAEWHAAGIAASDVGDISAWAATKLKEPRGPRTTPRLKREAADMLMRCSSAGQPAPWPLVFLIAELLDAQASAEVPAVVKPMHEAKWRIAIAVAAKYPEPPMRNPPRPAAAGKAPRRQASLAELQKATGVSINTIREWVELPEFGEAHRQARERASMSLTQRILSAQINAQETLGREWLDEF